MHTIFWCAIDGSETGTNLRYYESLEICSDECVLLNAISENIRYWPVLF